MKNKTKIQILSLLSFIIVIGIAFGIMELYSMGDLSGESLANEIRSMQKDTDEDASEEVLGTTTQEEVKEEEKDEENGGKKEEKKEEEKREEFTEIPIGNEEEEEELIEEEPIFNDDDEKDDNTNNSSTLEPLSVEDLSSNVQGWMETTPYHIKEMSEEEQFFLGIDENPGYVDENSLIYSIFVFGLFENDFKGKSVYGISYENEKEDEMIYIIFKYDSAAELQDNLTSIDRSIFEEDLGYNTKIVTYDNLLVVVSNSVTDDSENLSSIMSSFSKAGFKPV